LVLFAESVGLDLGDSNCLLITYFYAAFTSKTFFCVDRYRLIVLHLEDIHGTNLNAFLATLTFIVINLYLVTHMPVLLKN